MTASVQTQQNITRRCPLPSYIYLTADDIHTKHHLSSTRQAATHTKPFSAHNHTTPLLGVGVRGMEQYRIGLLFRRQPSWRGKATTHSVINERKWFVAFVADEEHRPSGQHTRCRSRGGARVSTANLESLEPEQRSRNSVGSVSSRSALCVWWWSCTVNATAGPITRLTCI